MEEFDYESVAPAGHIGVGDIVLLFGDVLLGKVGFGRRMVGLGLAGEAWLHRRRLEQRLPYSVGMRRLLWQRWKERWQNVEQD